MAERRRRGKCELGMARVLREVNQETPGLAALGPASLALARELDAGAGLATAAVGRELRAYVQALVGGGVNDDGETAAAQLLRQLSAPLDYSTKN